MCDDPTPCACTLEKRDQRRAAAIKRQDDLMALFSKLRRAKRLTKDDEHLLAYMIEREWDDAIHIASPDDPLRSLCGLYGRNHMDLPERPDSWGGCWQCLMDSEKLIEADTKEMVAA